MKTHNTRRRIGGGSLFTLLPFYLFTFLPFAAAFLLLSSCTHDEDDLFPESAAQRINHSVASYQELLTSSENGWVMEYLPADGSYGGRVYTAKFNGDGVTMASDVSVSTSDDSQSWPAGTELESKYSVKAEQGTILTFDTFNPQFHVWSMPLGSSAPDGYQSDYEFILEKTSEDLDTVYMRGKKYGNEMKMYKLQGIDPKTYIAGTIQLENSVGLEEMPTISVNGKDYSFDLSGNCFTIVDSTLENNQVEQPVFFNPSGFSLYKPIEINGASISDMILNSGDNAIETADGTAKIQIPTLQEQLMMPKGNRKVQSMSYGGPASYREYQNLHCYGWIFSGEEMCDSMKTLYKKFSEYNDYFNSMYEYNECWLGPAYQKYDIERRHFTHVIGYSWLFLFFGGVEETTYGVDYSYDEQTGLMTFTDRGEGYGYFNDYSTPEVNRRTFSPFCKYIFDHSPYLVTFNDGIIKTSIHLVSKDDSKVWFNLNLGTHTLPAAWNNDQ